MIWLAVALIAATKAQETMYSRADLRQDLEAAQRVLYQVHPGLFRYQSAGSVRRSFAQAKHSIGLRMSERGFLCVLSRMLAEIKDGHTNAVPSQEFRKVLRTQKKLPLRVRFCGTRLYVYGSADPQVPLGAELIAIDGHPVRQVCRNLIKMVSGDGDILSGRKWTLAETFPTLYWLGVERPARFVLRLRTPKGQVQNVRIDALLDPDTKARMTAPRWDPEDQTFGLRTLPEGVAVLTRPTFAPDSKFDFESFVRTSFVEINRKGTTDLILDMRGNNGGMPYGPLLASYLVDKPFQPYRSITARTNNLAVLREFSSLSPKFVADFESGLERRGNSFQMAAAKNPGLHAQAPSKNSFRGRLWVLIDGEVFSSAAELCSILKSQGRGIFVGEETGGAYNGHAGPDFVGIKLGHAGARFVLPLERINMSSNTSRDRRGICPDYPFSPKVSDVVNGKDSELEFVRTLIRRLDKSGNRVNSGAVP